MKSVQRCVAMLLLVALAPGASEVFENVAHLAFEGHLAHAAEAGDDHSEPDTEHGCNGTFHVCSCHVSKSFLTPSASAPGSSSTPDTWRTCSDPGSPRPGFHQVPERPPQSR